MQEKNRLFKTFLDRLEQLRLRQGWSWDECARQIGISKAMIFFIRSGKQDVSTKSWFKLEQAERAAGIASPESAAAATPAQASPPTPEKVDQPDIAEAVLEMSQQQAVAFKELRVALDLLITEVSELKRMLVISKNGGSKKS